MSYVDSMEDELDRLSEAVAAPRKENANLQADLDAALDWIEGLGTTDHTHELVARVEALLEKRRENK